jgi:hypothetical protein
MPWEYRLYVNRHDAALEEAWSAAGIRFSGFGTDAAGAWYRVRWDRREEAERLAQQGAPAGWGERVRRWLRGGR